jgi:hypothetical protein
MNLQDEMHRAVFEVRQPHLDALFAAGVPGEALADLGSRQAPFGVALISHNSEGLWWPDDAGVPRLLVPCYERGEIVDIVALKPARPDIWFHRTGAATILGADLLATCVKDVSLDVVGTPIDWLAKGGEAVCVLNWAAPFHELSPLRDWPELRVDSVRLSRIVRQRLSQPYPIPKITLELKEACRDLAA